MAAWAGYRIGERPLSRQWGCLLAALVVVVLVIARPAAAQALSAAEHSRLEARKEALFRQMLRNPGNLDATFSYAEVSAKLGDNEAAVSALERMLLFNPKLTRVKLELGALYFRMGSYAIARTYFNEALAAKPPQAVKRRIETYLDEIARLSAKQVLSGYFMLGGQWLSDANLAPGSPVQQTLIGPVLLNNQFVKKSDADFFSTGALRYSYDLGDQQHDTFEVGAEGFVNHYGSVSRLDLGIVELTAGPRFNYTDPLPHISHASLKPYAIVNDVSLGGDQYFHTLGVGLETTALGWHDIRIKTRFEFRDKNFNDAPSRPLSRGLNGTDKLVSLFVTKPITSKPESDLTFEFDFLAQDTRLAYYANKTYAGALSYHIKYDDPTGHLHFPWETTFFAGHSWADYDAPDPSASRSPFSFVPAVRHDGRWRIGITQSIQVAKNVAVVLQLQRDIVSSNLTLYGYTSNSVLIGPQIRF